VSGASMTVACEEEKNPENRKGSRRAQRTICTCG